MPDSPAQAVHSSGFARQWEEVGGDALVAVERVGRSGRLILDKEVGALEQDLARWWGVRFAVGVASGMDALEISLRCAGVSTGTRVLTTPLTAFATTLAIMRVGAVPVWVDVDESGGLDLELADAAMSADQTIEAILPVHLYGHPLDPQALEGLASRHSVVVVEDCAQSLGAARSGRPTGVVGTVSATSLYPTKNLGALGDGGVIVTDDAQFAERARRLRNYGQRLRNEHVEVGLNSRLDELHAAILRTAMLPRLDGWLDRRREIASRYTEALTGTQLRAIAATGGSSAHHLFPVEVLDVDPVRFADALARRGIQVDRHYPVLCCDQLAANGVGIALGSLPVARRLAERELSLPIHPHLREGEIAFVIDACLDACA